MVVYLLSYFVNNNKPLILDITESTLDGSVDSTIVPQITSSGIVLKKIYTDGIEREYLKMKNKICKAITKHLTRQ